MRDDELQNNRCPHCGGLIYLSRNGDLKCYRCGRNLSDMMSKPKSKEELIHELKKVSGCKEVHLVF